MTPFRRRVVLRHLSSTSDNDTIYALSSGLNAGQATAVAVLRVSGPQAGPILQKLTRNLKLPPPRKAALRHLYTTDEQLLDQALVLWFPGPNSFTGEDVVELHTHGSRAVVQDCLQALSQSGSRLAEAGEFTQRAFGNGKLNLLQTEGLADLLIAETSRQRVQALQQLQYNDQYDRWRSQLIGGLAHAEAVIDFGDDEHLDASTDDVDIGQENIWGGVRDQMSDLRNTMRQQLKDAKRGELVREGVQVAIVGAPNAGKSSLFNLLSNREAAIVSPQAGTTRDVLEVSLNLAGIKCILQDTAGVRSVTDDVIEQEGMKRALKAASEADLVLAMVDSSDSSGVGLDILQGVLKKDVDPKNVMLLLNKSDLDTTNSVDASHSLLEKLGGHHSISCVTQTGVDAFLAALTTKVDALVSVDSDNESPTEGLLITRARHRQHVEAAVAALDRFDVLSLQGPMVVDMAAEELRLAASELGRITGAVDVEDVLDKLFQDFCIGK